jgi:sugar phosphate isomerase/epimerase
MKILVRAHDLGKYNPKDIAKSVKEYGFDGAQLVLYKSIDGASPNAHEIDLNDIMDCAESFKEENLCVGMLGAYFNPVHSNKEKLNDNIERFKEYLGYTKLFNTLYVGSETGSYNDDKWTYNPKNRTDEALKEDIKIFKELAEVAKENDSYIALEGAYGHCMYEPTQLKKLIDSIQNNHVRVTVDIFNYLDYSKYDKEYQHKMLDDSLNYFKDIIVIYHLKDFIVDEENKKLRQVGLGEGIMDLKYIIDKALKYTPNAYLVFEGCPKDKMTSSLSYIKSLLNK